MKKSFTITMSLILSLFLMFSLSACGEKKDNDTAKDDNKSVNDEQNKDAEDKEKEDGKKDANENEAEDNYLIVATEAGFPPFEYMTDSGEIVGIDIDIAQAIADKLGKELKIKNMAFDGALLEVKNGKVDMVAAGVSVTEDRKKNMDFSEPYFESYQVLIVNAENPRIEEATKENIKGKIIGVQQGSVGDIWITDETEPAEIKRFAELAIAAMQLEQDKLDAVILDNVVAKEMADNSGGKLKILDGDSILKEAIAIALPKDAPDEFKNAVNEVIIELKDSGKIDELFEKHKTSEE